MYHFAFSVPWPVFRRWRSVFAPSFSSILSRELVGILLAVTEVHLTTLERAKATESLPDWLYFGGWRLILEKLEQAFAL